MKREKLGVYFDKRAGMWRVQVKSGGKYYGVQAPSKDHAMIMRKILEKYFDHTDSPSIDDLAGRYGMFETCQPKDKIEEIAFKWRAS